MIFHEVASGADRERASRIIAAVRPVHAVTAEELEVNDRMIPDAAPRIRCIGVVEGRDALLVRGCQAFWYDDEGLFGVDVVCPDEERPRFEAALRYVCEWARASGAARLHCWVFSWQPWQSDTLVSLGWETGQRNPQSVARPEGFAGDAGAAREAIEAAGLRLVNLAEWLAERGDEGLREVYEYDMTIMRDVPLPAPWQDIPYDKWKATLEGDRHHWPWTTLAVDGRRVAAKTQLFRNQLLPHIALTGLTGTRREHRRRGLARALKVDSMARAFADGVAEIHTDNEESNPMLELNKALGFQVGHELVEHRLSLEQWGG